MRDSVLQHIQRTSAYVSIRQHTSAYVSIRRVNRVRERSPPPAPSWQSMKQRAGRHPVRGDCKAPATHTICGKLDVCSRMLTYAHARSRMFASNLTCSTRHLWCARPRLRAAACAAAAMRATSVASHRFSDVSICTFVLVTQVLSY